MAKKKETQGNQELLETLNKSEAFLTRNKKLIITLLVILLALIAAIIAWNHYSDSRNEKASTALSHSQELFAQQNFDKALKGDSQLVILDCGESGSTRRFLAPIAAALGKSPVYKTAGRLADRPQIAYDEIKPGEFLLEGNVSSQFVTGLLFALPLLDGDSSIRFSSPLQSVSARLSSEISSVSGSEKLPPTRSLSEYPRTDTMSR